MSIKKYLLTVMLCLTLFSLGLKAKPVLAQSSLQPWLEELLDLNDMKALRNSDEDSFRDLIKDGEFPMQNMYLVMLQNVTNGPRDNAIKNLSIFTPYTVRDLEKIIMDGELEPLKARAFIEDPAMFSNLRLNEDNSNANSMWLAYSAAQYGEEKPQAKSKDLDIASIQKRYLALIELYKKELAYQTNHKEIYFRSLARSIFMNGNRFDSAGIDLLNDLDDIHMLFFGKSLIQIIEDEKENDDPSVTLSSEDEPKEPEETANASTSDSSTPPLCGDNESLRQAILLYQATRAESDASSASNGIEIDFNGNNQSQPKPSLALSNKVSLDDDATAREDRQTARKEQKDFLQTSIPSYKKELQDNIFCSGERFCIAIDFKYASWGLSSTEPGQVGGNPPTQKCYACHLAYIGEHLDKTLSKSLLPGRLSTNFFEDATCKQAAKHINLDFNIFSVGVPIVLHPQKNPFDLLVSKTEDIQNRVLVDTGFWYGKKARIQDALVNRYESRIKIDEKLAFVEAYTRDYEVSASTILEDEDSSREAQSRQFTSEILAKNLRVLQENIQLLQENLDAGTQTLNAIYNGKQSCQ